jgi:hypothetical protein
MRPIVNKYREGKMKTTLNGEFKGGEGVMGEGDFVNPPVLKHGPRSGRRGLFKDGRDLDSDGRPERW